MCLCKCVYVCVYVYVCVSVAFVDFCDGTFFALFFAFTGNRLDGFEFARIFERSARSLFRYGFVVYSQLSDFLTFLKHSRWDLGRV